MLLTGKIKTLTNDGAPDYNICSQASAVLSMTNMTFIMTLSKSNGANYVLVTTSDLSSYVASGLPITYTYGNYDIKFSDFDLDTVNGAFQAKLEVFYTGTTDVVTWEKFNITLQIAKTGYQSYLNTFELYNYDVGNTTGTAGLSGASVGNTDFEIFLVNNTNNLDTYGRQTQVSSKFIGLRRPFTDEIHFYNMIGTQGTISYSDVDGVIGMGGHLLIHEEGEIYVEQTISVSTDSCTTNLMMLTEVWFPSFIPSFSSADTCDGCTNNIAITTASYYRDATLVVVYRINGASYFLSEFMTEKITIEVLNYKSEIINTHTDTSSLDYATWIATPAVFLTPTDWNFTPAEIGQNVLSFTDLFCYEGGDTQELYKCLENFLLETCNWWRVETTDTCSKYKITNCSDAVLIVVLQQMQEDKTFTDLSTNEIDPMDSLELSFAVDGIYVLKATSTHITGTAYYTLPVFCNLQTCFLSKLQETLCNKVTEGNCLEQKHYDFNVLVINTHTYFLLLTEELTDDEFIYASLSSAKVDSLYDLKTFIDRFEEYCSSSENPCAPCNE